MSQGEASNSLRIWEFRGYAHYSELPKMADTVIEATKSGCHLRSGILVL
jgi:hypothetical protein